RLRDRSPVERDRVLPFAAPVCDQRSQVKDVAGRALRKGFRPRDDRLGSLRPAVVEKDAAELECEACTERLGRASRGVRLRAREFALVDTGGLDDGTSEVEAGVRRQAEAAIEEADVVMFVVDAQSGILPVEHDVADRLRRSRKPVVMAANKSESWKTEAQAAEFYELGLGELHTVSALQGIGTGDLLDAVVAKLPPPAEDEPDTAEARIAI